MSYELLIPLAGMAICCAGCVLVNVLSGLIVKLSGLFLLYFGSAVLLLNVISPQMCVALLVCGIGVSVLLGTSQRFGPADFLPDAKNRPQLLFHSVLALMSAILAFTMGDLLHFWIPVRQRILFVTLWIPLLSLLNLSLDDNLLYRCIYLQTICLAFTVIYIYMESSALIFAFFAIINLLMAFGGSMLSLGKISEQDDQKWSNI